jgi:cysteinyl-tRNA synthetase
METLRTAARHVRRYQEAAERVETAAADAESSRQNEALAEALTESADRTLAAMCDDLNTPAATAAALEGLKAIEQADDLTGAADAATSWLERVNTLLGVVAHEHTPAERTGADAAPSGDDAPDFSGAVDDLLDERAEARSEGAYERADAIRDTLEAMGIEIMDSPEGTTWRRKTTL